MGDFECMKEDSEPAFPSQGNSATAAIPQIPPSVASNIMVFMRRVKMDGIEAMAWAEAYHCLAQFAVPPPGLQQGVPFNGLPK